MDYTMLTLIAGLVLFFGLHSISIVARDWRDAMVRRMGEGAWKGIYSVLSAVSLTLIIVGFAHARANAPVLYVPPASLRYLTFLLMLPVFPLLLAAYLPGRIQSRSRHPMLAAIKLWATAHLLAIGALPDVLLFGAFLVWAVFDRISVKRHPRTARRLPPTMRYGDLVAVVVGLGLYVLFVLKLHALLIGVAPLAPPL
jgi:uncharacterized membrane protein